MSHTKEPWETGGPDLSGVFAVKDGAFIADCAGAWRKHVARSDAERIVACVNVCAGLPDPKENIKELVEAARLALKSECAHACLNQSVLPELAERIHTEVCIFLRKALAPFPKSQEKKK